MARGAGQPCQADHTEQILGMVKNQAGCLKLAVGVGFEPTEPRGSLVFKTSAIGRSATPPILNFSSATVSATVGLRN